MDKLTAAQATEKTAETKEGYISFPAFPSFSPLFILWFATLLSIGGAGYWSYQQQLTAARHTAFERIRDMGDLKAQQLLRWLQERHDDATTLFKDHLAVGLQDFLIDPTDSKLRDETRTWMESLTRYYSYSDILLLNNQGQLLLSIPPERPPIDKTTQAWRFVEQALNTHEVVFSDLYIVKEGMSRLDFIVPILTEAGPPQNKLVALLLLRIDPNDFLFPLLDKWPSQSKTTETLLIRRQGEFIMYLNRGRHGTAEDVLLQEVPLDSSRLIAAASLKRQSGELMGLDRRGVYVIAAVRPIPNSEWYLLAKIDRAEVDAPLRQGMRRMFTIMVLAILATTLGLWLIWRRQRERLLQRQKEALERQVESRTRALITANRALQVALGERQLFVSEIEYQATHDALTGLINRSEFERRLQHLLDSTCTSLSTHALCYLDLDQFKIVNDHCGHTAGDQLLRQLAHLFQARVRQRDTLARLGGDEFGVLLESCTPEQAQRLATELRQVVEEFRFVWEEKSFYIGVSIGLVAIDRHSDSVAAVLRAADSACYVAKDAGRNRIHVFDEQDQDLAKRRGEFLWVTRIPQALEENRFMLYAQAIFPLHPGAVIGTHYELLLRLQDSDGRIIAPGVFLPAAEHYQLAVRLDRWVVATALQRLTHHPLFLDSVALCAINLSGQSMGDAEFLAFLLQQLDETGFPAERLCFEITETAAIANLVEAIRFMNALKQRGCRFALDDFGSGLSSFAYLKNLPVDFVKIDGLFVKNITDDPLDLAMVRSINEIGQLMGKQTVAEFVENDTVLAKLRELGVDYGQGYGVGRPQPLSDLLEQRFAL